MPQPPVWAAKGLRVEATRRWLSSPDDLVFLSGTVIRAESDLVVASFPYGRGIEVVEFRPGPDGRWSHGCRHEEIVLYQPEDLELELLKGDRASRAVAALTALLDEEG